MKAEGGRMNEEGELATEGTESTETASCFAKASQDVTPELSEEQREWLNKVFIPNFRAELMRTLELKGHLKDGSIHKSVSATEKGREGSGADEGAASPTPDVNGTPADVDGSTSSPRGAASSPLGARAERLTELEGDASTSSPRETWTGGQDALRTAGRMPALLDGELEAENKRLRAALAETRVDRELVWAAASQHAINPAQVAHLMKERVRLDKDLEPVVVDAQGDRMTDRNGQAVTVADAVRAFLEENPHMVQPSGELVGGGTNATVMTGRTPALTGGELIAEALRAGA
jgi:hypothetical protein